MRPKTIPISEIKILPCFAEHPPSQRKIFKKMCDYLRHNKQIKPIVLNRNGYLIDRYATYLALQELGISEVKYVMSYNSVGNYDKNVRYDYHNCNTTYVYGKHRGCDKEFVWRVSEGKREWVKENISIGDKVVVQTKYGNKCVMVIKIVELDKPPVDIKIRKVLKKVEVK